MLGILADSTRGRVRSPKYQVSPRRWRRREERYSQAGVEPPLEDLLNDPVTAAIMRCDNVSANTLRSLVDTARANLKVRTGTP
jgi:hypothetical protein